MLEVEERKNVGQSLVLLTSNSREVKLIRFKTTMALAIISCLEERIGGKHDKIGNIVPVQDTVFYQY